MIIFIILLYRKNKKLIHDMIYDLTTMITHLHVPHIIIWYTTQFYNFKYYGIMCFIYTVCNYHIS